MALDGTILQHCNRYEYLKNDCGVLLWCCNHINRKEVLVLTESLCRNVLILEKYIEPYTHGYDKVFEYTAIEIQEHAECECDYEGDDALVNYLAKG